MKYFGLLGYPLGHSLSPQLHRLLAKELGKEVDYQLFPIPTQTSKEELEKKMFCLDGFNVTIPYKIRMLESMDQLDSSAKLHRSVNVAARCSDGKWKGYNTDCIGFVRSMQANGIALSGSVCVLGAGGVGRMFATECVRHGCKVVLAVREKAMQSAQQVVQHILEVFPDALVEVQLISALSGPFDLMINATPCGMFPHTDEMPVDPPVLKQTKAVFDCIYNPQKTMLMHKAEEMGCKVVGGLGMLCWQAAAAQEIWMDVSFSEEQVSRVMRTLEQNFAG